MADEGWSFTRPSATLPTGGWQAPATMSRAVPSSLLPGFGNSSAGTGLSRQEATATASTPPPEPSARAFARLGLEVDSDVDLDDLDLADGAGDVGPAVVPRVLPPTAATISPAPARTVSRAKPRTRQAGQGRPTRQRREPAGAGSWQPATVAGPRVPPANGAQGALKGAVPLAVALLVFAGPSALSAVSDLANHFGGSSQVQVQPESPTVVEEQWGGANVPAGWSLGDHTTQLDTFTLDGSEIATLRLGVQPAGKSLAQGCATAWRSISSGAKAVRAAASPIAGQKSVGLQSSDGTERLWCASGPKGLIRVVHAQQIPWHEQATDAMEEVASTFH